MAEGICKEILDELGLPYRFHHFEVEEAVAPPFSVWMITETRNVYADGIVYHTTEIVAIELYTDSKNFLLEEKLEGILEKYSIQWEKEEYYIESERLYETVYKFEV